MRDPLPPGHRRRGALGVTSGQSGLIRTPPRSPNGVEIATWAERPELARGMYEVALEALPDIPEFEDDDIEPFDDWRAHDMQGSGDR